VDYRVGRFRAGLSLFRNDVRNLIDSVNIGTPRTEEQLMALLTQFGIPTSFTPLLNRQTFIYQNFGRIHTQGFELDAERAITRQLRVVGAYTYLDARDSGTKLALPQRHKHQGYMRTEYVNQRLGLLTNLRGTFFSPWYLNPAAGTRALGYQIWDFYISKNLSHGAQAFFTIDNFANSRDQKLAMVSPTFDRPDFGRQYRIGLRWRFGGVE
jgi:outer membrane cobalamin receptor